MNRNTETGNLNKMEHFLNLLLLTLVAAGYTSAADITAHCSEYIDGERANASFTINTTTVNGSPCAAGVLTDIYFRFKNISNNTTMDNYNAAYNPSGPCDGTWQANVSCVSHDTSKNIITYTLQFVANYTLHGQQYLTVETNCFPLGPNTPFSVDYSSCNPIRFHISTTIKNGASSLIDIPNLEVLLIWSMTKVIWLLSS